MSYFLILFHIFATLQSVLSDCRVTSSSENKYLTQIEPLKGKTVDVSDVALNYTYTIRFCDAIEGLDEADVGVEQYLMPGKTPFRVVGKITATNIVAGTNWIFLEYRDGDTFNQHCNGETRRATIFIMCDPSGLLVNPVLIEENRDRDSECAYVFEVGSSVACSNSSSTPSTTSGGIGVGGIIVISALTIAAAYLILGVLYKRFCLRAKGREQIPNIDFWINFGSLTADGCDYVCRCNKKQESKSYKGLGDDQLGLDEDEERDENILPMY